MSTANFSRWLFRSGVAVGTPIQSVLVTASGLQAVSTTIPLDDTVPTSSEGTELTNLVTAFTPKRVGNKIRVTVNIFCSATTQTNVISTLFKDSGASAIASSGSTAINSSYLININYVYEEIASSLTPITFKPRLGPTTAATVNLNGVSGSRLFGGKAVSSLLIEEIQL